MNNPVENPYVGTRTFSEEDAPRFFGREREARDLLALVTFEQVVLFYAQSGTGKSSLVNTQLIPGLEKNGRFEVLTPSRVTGDIPLDAASENLYAYSLMQNLANHFVEPAWLAGLRIKDFLPKLVRDAASAKRSFIVGSGDETDKPRRRVLIIDQFEELFTTHPEEWESRSDFFEQLAEALEADQNLWVVLVMREDYIAYLDPYAHIMPGGLRVRYYMQKMDYEDALKAVKSPAENAGRPYQEGVAEQLVDDLRGRQLRRRAGKKQTVLGQYVEPIVLQAVCSTLWENLDPENTPITISDLKKLGNVNKALGKYYEKRVHEVAIMDEVKKLGIRESEIRNWIGTQLITSGGRRNIVVRNAGGKSGGLDDSVVQLFSKRKDLIREEGHGAASIYELTHDRLAEPILESNKEWEKQHGFPFHPQVILWSEAKGRGKEVHLLSEMALDEAEKWILKNQDQLSNLESEFLEACRAKKQEEANQRAQGVQRQEREREIQKQKLEAAEKLASEQARFAQQQAEANLRIRKALRTSTVVAGIASLLLIIAIALGIQSNRYQRTIQRRALIDASFIEYQQDKKLGATLAYQALKQFDDYGQVEQDVANIFYDMNDRVSVQSPFIIPTTINAVGSIAFNPADGGQTLAAGYTDGKIFLIDLATLRPIGEPFSGHTANVASLSFSPDGKTLASGSWDSTIILWDVETRQPIGQPLSVHTGQVTSVAFSPDGKTLASGSWDNTIMLWDVESQSPIGSPLRGHSFYVFSVAFSPDGKTLASGSYDNTIILWDVANQTPIGQPLLGHTNYVTSVAFSPDGKTLASGSYDYTIILWNVATRQQVGDPLRGHADWVNTIAFSPDGNILASGGDTIDRTIILWNTATRQPIGDPLGGINNNNNVTSLAFSPDGKTLAGSSINEDEILLWDVATGSREASISAPVQKDRINVAAMSISSTGEIQGITSTERMVWNPHNAVPLETLDFDAARPVQSLESIYHLDSITFQISALSPDGKHRVVGDSNTAKVIDIATHETVSQVRHGINTAVSAVAFSQQGEYVASADDDNRVRIWDTKSGRVIAQIYSDIDALPVSLSFSPDAARIVIAYADEQSTIEVWDIATKQKILVIAYGQFKPLDYTLASSAGLFDGKENETNEPSQEQTEQVGNPIADVAYLQDGLLIIYNNGSVDHWDIWPSRTFLEAEALSICDPCEMNATQREEYGLFTWPMRVQDYAGYLIGFFMVLVYGFGARRVYNKVIKNPVPVDQNAKPGFSWKKFLSASAQGMVLTLVGILGWGIVGLIEPIMYSDLARDPDEVIFLLALLLLPLGLWAGGAYCHLTLLQSGGWSRTKRTLIGMFSGVLSGFISGLMGVIILGYLVTKDLDLVFSDTETILAVPFLAGGVTGLMSLLGALIYIFLLQPWSAEGRISREGQILLQLLFGIGMFFERRKTIRKWIYPLAVVEMISFWLLVPPFDLDFSFFDGDILQDSNAAMLGLIGFIIHLFGLFDVWRSMKVNAGTTVPFPWKRGLITAVAGTVLGFMFLYLEQGNIQGYDISPVILISMVLGLFGLMFYVHKISYILTAALGGIGTLLLFLSSDSLPIALWLGLGSGFILSAMISRILHAMKKI